MYWYVPKWCLNMYSKPRVSTTSHQPEWEKGARWDLLLWFKPSPGKDPPQSLALPTARDVKSDILWEPRMKKFFRGFYPMARHQFLSNLKMLASLVRFELDAATLIGIEYCRICMYEYVACIWIATWNGVTAVGMLKPRSPGFAALRIHGCPTAFEGFEWCHLIEGKFRWKMMKRLCNQTLSVGKPS